MVSQAMRRHVLTCRTNSGRPSTAEEGASTRGRFAAPSGPYKDMTTPRFDWRTVQRAQTSASSFSSFLVIAGEFCT
jgi:hypothetical protein